jgi:hypothetical protein
MASDITQLTLLEEIRADLDAAIRQYRRVTIPPRLIREMMDDNPDLSVRQFLASYPDTPSRVLTQLAEESLEGEVLGAIAVHSRTPKPVMQKLAAEAPEAIRQQLAANKNLTPQVAALLAEDPSFEVRLALANNPAIPPRIQAMLAQDSVPFVRAALLRNKQLEAETLANLADDEDLFVRSRAMLSSAVPERKLLEWADSDQMMSQHLLLQRGDLPANVQESLCFSQHPSVQKLAIEQRQLAMDELLGWTENGDAVIRGLIAGREGVPAEIQEILARDTDIAVRQALALNPDIAEPVALKLALVPDEPVWLCLAENPQTPERVQQMLCQRNSPRINKILAGRGHLSPDLLQQLVELNDDTICYHLVQNPTLSFSELEANVAERLSEHTLPSLRAAAAESCFLSEHTLARLAHDPAPMVRLKVCANPELSAEILHEMLADPDKAVAAAVQKQLELLAAPPAPETQIPPSPSKKEGLLKRILRKVMPA